MRQGLRAVIRHAFAAQAAPRRGEHQPANTASTPFGRADSPEGLPRYLKIGGQWRDHEHGRYRFRAAHGRIIFGAACCSLLSCSEGKAQWL
jgi:hypothetical protein